MKASIGFSMVVFASAVLCSHASESIYPYLPAGMIVSVALILLTILYQDSVDKSTAFIALSTFILLSVLYKTTLFMLPTSLIGYDTGLYAQLIQIVASTNRLSPLNSSVVSFYAKAPLFILLVSITDIVGRTTTKVALIVYPLLVGILYPVMAFAFARRVAPVEPLRIATIASAVSTVGTLSLQYGFHPIAQTLAVLLWLPFLLIVARYYIHNRNSDFLLLSLLLAALLLTHKAPGIVVIGTFLCLLAFDISTRKLDQRRPIVNNKSVIVLLLLSGIALVVQLTFLTDYLGRFTLLGIALLSPEFLSVFFERILTLFGGSGSAAPQASESVINPLLVTLMNTLYGLFLFPLAALGWTWLFVRNRSDPNVRVVLAGSAFIMAIVLLGYIRRSVVNPRRFVFFAGVILVVLASIAISLISNDIGDRLSIAKIPTALLLLFMLLATQSFATPALPNHSVDERDYLTTTELSAKQFTHSYVPGQVHTDNFYAIKPPASPAKLGQPREYISMEEELLWRSENLTSHNYVLLRKDVKVYRTSGKVWRLTWDVQRWFDQKYSQVYSNDDVRMYTKPHNRSM